MWILWFLTYQTKRVETYLRKLIHQEYICIYSYTAYVIQLCLLWCTFLSILNAENNLAAQSDWTGIYIIYIQHLHRLIPYLTAMFDELDVVSCHFNRAIFLHNMMEQEYMMIWTRIYMFIYSYKHLILCRLHNPIMSHLQLIQLSYLHLCAWHTRARVSWLPITGYLKLHISFFFSQCENFSCSLIFCAPSACALECWPIKLLALARLAQSGRGMGVNGTLG